MTPTDDAATVLAAALSPDQRPPDHRFAEQVRLAVAEATRFRNWRRAALRRIGSDALVLFALAGPALALVRIAAASAELGAPTLAALVATIVVGGWLAMSGEFRRTIAY